MRAKLTYTYDDTNGNYVASFSGATRTQGKSGTAPQLYELIGVDYDSEKWDELIDYLTVDEMVQLPYHRIGQNRQTAYRRPGRTCGIYRVYGRSDGA